MGGITRKKKDDIKLFLLYMLIHRYICLLLHVIVFILWPYISQGHRLVLVSQGLLLLDVGCVLWLI